MQNMIFKSQQKIYQISTSNKICNLQITSINLYGTIIIPFNSKQMLFIYSFLFLWDHLIPDICQWKIYITPKNNEIFDN